MILVKQFNQIHRQPEKNDTNSWYAHMETHFLIEWINERSLYDENNFRSAHYQRNTQQRIYE